LVRKARVRVRVKVKVGSARRITIMKHTPQQPNAA
jgi:hypothetical protein